ncbi:YeeE/YedE family protein [Octadecabacter sp.]|nr:YeeE/YedE family protein [Octadecabacter sp.]
MKLPIPVIVAAVLLVSVTLRTWQQGNQTLALAVLIGAVAGFSLYHASFGFTAGWRRIVSEARSSGLRAQFVLIGLTALVSYPLIANGAANGWVNPVNVSLIFGAFMFGIGMQLGGGCGSGTLFVVGGGSTRMVITLTFFIIGSVIGVAHLPFWFSLPSAGRFSMIDAFGAVGALIALFAIMGVLTFLALWREKTVHGNIEPARKTTGFLKGPWSPWIGAILLAVVGILTLLLLNRPWGITSAFGFWGAKGLYAMGIPTDHWTLTRWSQGTLDRSVFNHSTSVMDFGVIIGAMIAASIAGKWRPIFNLTFHDVWTAVAGGLLMGYGARLSGGCNIGAYLGGLVSGSAHAWIWGLLAFAGSSLVVWLRFRRTLLPAAA